MRNFFRNSLNTGCSRELLRFRGGGVRGKVVRNYFRSSLNTGCSRELLRFRGE